MTQRYPLIPLDQVISEIRFSFPKMDERGEIDEDLCYMHGRSALRLIGFNCYEPQEAIIPIKKYVGTIPSNYYLFDNCYRVPDNYSTGGQVYDDWRMHPVNYSDLRKVPGTDIDIIPGASAADQGFVFDVKRMVIRTRFQDGSVLLLFSGLPKNEDGNLCMPDEENTVKAVKAYMSMELFREKAYSGEMALALWQTITNDWDTYKDNAMSAMRALTNMDMDLMMADKRARYRNFEIFRKFS